MSSHTEDHSISVLVSGEALIDFIPSEHEGAHYHALPGGSPFNVAVGLARLGVASGFLGKLSTDALGRRIRRTLAENGVSTAFVLDDEGPTTLAVVAREPGRDPQFTFYGHAAADQQLTVGDLPANLSHHVRILHFGSYSMSCRPIGAALSHLMKREAESRIISFDPNIRPSLIPDLARYREQLDDWVSMSHIVKLSLADLAILFPDLRPRDLADRWLRRGRPHLLVVTQAEAGAVAFTAEHTVEVPAPTVKVVDAVGAGDAFMSGLLTRLIELRVHSQETLAQLNPTQIEQAIAFAATVAAITCTRRGADPPRRDEVLLP